MENNIMRENKYFCRKTRNNNHNINYLHMKTRKKLLLLLLVGMMWVSTYGQTTTPSSSYNQTNNKVYDVIEEQPSFPGGQNALNAPYNSRCQTIVWQGLYEKYWPLSVSENDWHKPHYYRIVNMDI